MLLKTRPDLSLLFNHFNNDTPENGSDLENLIQSKYHFDVIAIIGIFSRRHIKFAMT